MEKFNIFGSSGSIVIPETGRFVASENFKCPGDKSHSLPIVVHESFWRRFLAPSMDKIEDPMDEHHLFYSDLGAKAHDNQIIDALGGVTEVVSTLAEIFFLANEHAQGRESGLSIYYKNIFYVRDKNKGLCSVDLCIQQCLSIDLSNQGYRSLGHRVFHCGSVCKPTKE